MARPQPLLVTLILLLVAFPSFAAESKPSTPNIRPGFTPTTNAVALANHARRVYEDTRAFAEKHPNNPDALARFARAGFEWADYSSSNSQREAIAQRGIQAARKAVALDPNHANAHYTLALNLGQLARTRTLTALRIVQEMEAAFLKAIQLDPRLDFSGPRRALGILYQDAPGWPVSIGNRKKAREQFDRALELHPGYPGNALCLIEALVEWNETQAAREKLPAAHRVLLDARKELTGDHWAASWNEWDQRWHALTNRLGPVTAGKGVSPGI